MSTLASSLVSSRTRAAPLRMRGDLVVREHSYQGRTFWVVKDPIGLRYYRFLEEEFAILEMLDGVSSLEQIQRRFERRFPPQRIGLQELSGLISRLHRSELVISDAAGQADQLLDRQRQRTRQERFASLTNILCIRLRGIDPEGLLNWLDRRFGWFFSAPAVLCCLLMAVSALLLVAMDFETFRARLPQFRDFFAAQNWLWLGLTLAATKVAHELGHGLTCKRLGGECHEMGVMLLVLTPCLYCNVSDSWLLPNRWHRAAIGAAGMYVEMVLATLATYVWWFTEPGMLNYLALNVMFVCSVSTLLFNANPLMRYDGYYILSDLLEIPNLRQKASSILQRKLGAWLLGIVPPHDPFLPERHQALFALYTIASALYQWVITFSILLFLQRVFEPYGLQVLGQLLAMMALAMLVVRPLWQLAQFFYVPGRIDKVNPWRFYASATATAALLALALLAPLPQYVTGTLQIQPRDARSVYIDVPGTLEQIHAEPGQPVTRSQPLVTLASLDLDLAIAQLEGERRQYLSQLQGLRQREFSDPEAGLEIARVQEAWSTIEEQLTKRQRDRNRLAVAAPCDGVVIAPPLRAAAPRDGQLPVWHGTPLERTNLGATLPEGVLVCQVGDPTQLEAVIALDQSDIELVQPGQAVRLALDALPGKILTSQIAEVSRLEMKTSPTALAAQHGGKMATRVDASGVLRPLNTTYQASAPLTDAARLLPVGATGRCRIHTGHSTLVAMAWRYFSQTFNFRL